MRSVKDFALCLYRAHHSEQEWHVDIINFGGAGKKHIEAYESMASHVLQHYVQSKSILIPTAEDVKKLATQFLLIWAGSNNISDLKYYGDSVWKSYTSQAEYVLEHFELKTI